MCVCVCGRGGGEKEGGEMCKRRVINLIYVFIVGEGRRGEGKVTCVCCWQGKEGKEGRREERRRRRREKEERREEDREGGGRMRGRGEGGGEEEREEERKEGWGSRCTCIGM